MAFALVDSITENLGFNGGATAGAFDSTGANLLIACVSKYASATATVTDSKSNTWNMLVEFSFATEADIQIWYSVPTSVGTLHTFTVSGTGVTSSTHVTAWAGAHATPADQTNGAGADTGTTQQPGSVTPGTDDQLVVTCITNGTNTNDTGRAINSGFTISGEIGEQSGSYDVAGAYLVQTTATPVNPTWSNLISTYRNSAIATFKAAGGGSGVGNLIAKVYHHRNRN